jgi:hypothetical protein
MWSKRQYSGQNGHNMAKRQKLPKIIKMCPRREIMVKIVKKKCSQFEFKTAKNAFNSQNVTKTAKNGKCRKTWRYCQKSLKCSECSPNG